MDLKHFLRVESMNIKTPKGNHSGKPDFMIMSLETRALNRAVRRNIKSFPDDFMFSLTREEIMNLSQIVTSSKIKHNPNVFVYYDLRNIHVLFNTLQGVQLLAKNCHNGYLGLFRWR